MLLGLIVACEIGFWVLLFGGLFARYVMKWPRVGRTLLLCVPLLDLVLLAATALDLHRGTPAEFAHGLAAIYLGFTIVYGHSVMRWMDQQVAYRFASGPRPARPPQQGWARAVYEWKQWLKGVAAGCIAAVLLFIAIRYIGEPAQTAPLAEWFEYIFWVLAIWLVLWPLWYSVFPNKKNASGG